MVHEDQEVYPKSPDRKVERSRYKELVKVPLHLGSQGLYSLHRDDSTTNSTIPGCSAMRLCELRGRVVGRRGRGDVWAGFGAWLALAARPEPALPRACRLQRGGRRLGEVGLN